MKTEIEMKQELESNGYKFQESEKDGWGGYTESYILCPNGMKILCDEGNFITQNEIEYAYNSMKMSKQIGSLREFVLFACSESGKSYHDYYQSIYNKSKSLKHKFDL